MKTMQKILALLLVAMMVIGMAACGSKTETEQPKTEEKKEAETKTEEKKEEAPAKEPARDDVIIAYTSEPPALDLETHDSLISVGLNMMTFNGLTKVNMETLAIEPDLAKSWEVKDDTDWYFYLQEGVKFHDGADFTAEDVKASIEYAKTYPASANYTKNIVDIQVIDDYTVMIKTDGVYSGLASDLAFHFNWIMDKDLIDAGHDFNEEPIGTGPYVLKEWISGTSITFEKNENYWDKNDMAKIKTVKIVIIPEGASRAIALQSGEVDFVWELSAADVSSVEAAGGNKIYVVDSVDNVNLFFNNDLAPYDNKDFRRAVSAAINRQDIIDGAMGGYGLINYTNLSMGYPEYTTENQIPYDVEKAKEYLTAWGGDPSTVNMDILVSNETRVAIATIIQNNMKKVGLDATVQYRDTATYFQEMKLPTAHSYIASWSPANAMTYAQRFATSRRETNPGSYNNPEMDGMIADAQATMDDAARKEKIEKIIAQVNLDAPQIPLYQSQWIRAYNEKLGGVVCSGTGYMYAHKMFWTE